MSKDLERISYSAFIAFTLLIFVLPIFYSPLPSIQTRQNTSPIIILTGGRTYNRNATNNTTIENRAPSAPTNITINDLHTLRPTITWNASIDPEGDNVTYTLNITTEDGNETASGIVDTNLYILPVNLTFNQWYLVNLTAWDTQGAFNSTNWSFQIINEAPVLTLISPTNCTNVSSPDPVLKWC